MSHGQTELIYDWSGSTSAAWCRGSRMSGMGVRSGSRFSLSIISGIAGRLWLAGWIHEAFHSYRDRLEARRLYIRHDGEVDVFKWLETHAAVHGSCFIFKKRENPSFLLSLHMQQPWFTQQWHHGDHSYFYWLLHVQLLSVLCHLSNLQQSTTPWEKKKKKRSTTQKWLRGERWNVICACRATVSGVFHKSNVLLLLLLLLSFMHPSSDTPLGSCDIHFKLVVSLWRWTTANL